MNTFLLMPDSDHLHTGETVIVRGHLPPERERVAPYRFQWVTPTVLERADGSLVKLIEVTL